MCQREHNLTLEERECCQLERELLLVNSGLNSSDWNERPFRVGGSQSSLCCTYPPWRTHTDAHTNTHMYIHSYVCSCALASIFMVYPPFKLRLTFLWHELGHRVLHEACAEFIEFLRNISLYKTGFLDFFCKTVFRCCCCYFYFYLVSCSLLLPFGRAPLLFFLQYVHVSLYVSVCECGEYLCVISIRLPSKPDFENTK